MPFRTALLAILIACGAVSGAFAQTGGPTFVERLVEAAKERTRHKVVYDGSYVVIAYPGGDVPPNRGVCTDLVIRAYRALGIDLQVDVHEDMKARFDVYPKIWGLSRPDTNIDHRRVPNLEVFFARKGEQLPIGAQGREFHPGDIVTWRLGGRLPHIGIVTDKLSADGERPLVVHNIGDGPKLEDMLFDHPISGRFRYAAGMP